MSAESDRRLAAEIERRKNERLADLTPSADPVRANGQRPQFFLIAGQQGAGKSTTQAKLMQALQGAGNRSFAAYDGDDNSRVHPRYDQIMRDNGIRGAEVVGDELDSLGHGRHHDEYMAHLLGDKGGPKYDVVASGPLKDEGHVDWWLDGPRSRGYETTLVFVATNDANSSLGIAHRYQKDRDDLGYGRWVPGRSHRQVYQQDPHTANQAESKGKADHVYVVDPDGNVLYSHHRDPGQTTRRIPGAGRAIEGERQRPPTPAESARFDEKVGYFRNRPSRAEPLHGAVAQAVNSAERDHRALRSSGPGTAGRARSATIDDAVVAQLRSPTGNADPGGPARGKPRDGGPGHSGSGGPGSDGPDGTGGGLPSPPGPDPQGPRGGPTRTGGRRGGGGRLTGRIAGVVGAAAVTLAGVGSAAGMSPELSAALTSPTAVVQRVAGYAPDMAGGLLGKASSAAQMLRRPATVKPMPAGGESSRLAADSKVATSAVKAQTDAVKAQADAVKKSSDAMKSHVSGVQKFGAAQKAVTAGSKAWAVAQTLLNVVMSANPIGAIVVGIAAAVAAIVLLVKNWDKVKLAFDWVYKNVLLPVGNWFKNIWTETVVPAFKAATDMISGLFSALGDSIKGVWDGVMSGIKWVVGKIADALSMISNVGFGPVRTPDLSGLVDRLRSFSGGEKKADGGVIRGPGGPRGDAIAAWLSDGEYVINAASTARYKPLLDLINFGVPRTAADESQQAMRGLLGPEKVVTADKAGTAGAWSRARDGFGSTASQFATTHISDGIGDPGSRYAATGLVSGFAQDGASTDAQRDSSLVNIAATDADTLASLSDPPVPAQITGSCPGTGKPKINRVTTINIHGPDANTEFQKARTWESQRALTYTGRW